VICGSKSPQQFFSLGLKIKQATVCRLRHKTDGRSCRLRYKTDGRSTGGGAMVDGACDTIMEGVSRSS
jgi:hypothetical protein